MGLVLLSVRNRSIIVCLIALHEHACFWLISVHLSRVFHFCCLIFYDEEHLFPFLKASPNLLTLRLNLLSNFYARDWHDYDMLLNELAESCKHLEDLQIMTAPADQWEEQERRHALAEYYEGAGPTTKLVAWLGSPCFCLCEASCLIVVWCF